MNVLTQLISLMPEHRKRQAPLIILLMVLGAGFEVLGIGLVIPFMEIAIGSEENPVNQFFISSFETLNKQDLILLGVFLFAFVYLLKGFYLSFLGWILGLYTYNIKSEIGNNLMRGYLNSTYEFHLRHNSSHLIRNLTTETNQLVAFAIIPMLTIGSELAVVFGIGTFLFLIEPLGTVLVMLLLIILSISFQHFVGGLSKKLGESRQIADGLIMKKCQEALGGIKDVIVLGKANYFAQQFCEQNQISSEVAGKQFALGQLPRVYLETIGVLIFSVLVFVLTQRASNVLIIIPTLSIFALSAFRLLPSANRLLSAFNSLRYSEAVIKTLKEQQTLTQYPFPEQTKDDQKNSKLHFKSKITIQNVCFQYPDTEVHSLLNISFNIHKGESIGIIGKSGAGKSTLSDIFLGLLSPTSGAIYLDGTNVHDSIVSWQKKIGYVQQEIFLLDESIKKNIAFGVPEHEIDEKSIKKSIVDANLKEFIYSLPNGLNTQLGERGVRLSGGQKQRIGIARALYRDTPILVFDEATSALDDETESEIVKAIENLKNVKTILVIAHRHSTIAHCDRIIDLKRGEVSRIFNTGQEI